MFGGAAVGERRSVDAMAIDLAGRTYDPSTASDLVPALSPAQLFFYHRQPRSPFTGGVPSGRPARSPGPAAANPDPGPKVCVMPGGGRGRRRR